MSLRNVLAGLHKSGFTLVELMVVVAILAVLLGAVLKVTSSVMNNANVQQTKAIMFNIEQAIDQFKLDAPLKGVKDYRDRYGGYPCDELEPFLRNGADRGIPKDVPPLDRRVIAPGRDSDLNVAPTAMADDPSAGIRANRSIRAMALTIGLYSPEGAAILDRISSKYRRPPKRREEFFDRDGNGDLDIDDVPLIYFVDAWGTALDYFALNPVPASPTDVDAPTDSQGRRRAASKFLVGNNRGRPLLVSYGPDGPEQRSADFNQMPAGGLVEDYNATEPDPDVIDEPLNDDNVYLDDTLKERLKQP